MHSALRAWLNRGRLTVAHIERAHAANKHSFDAVRTSKRHVEAAVYHSFLRQHMVWHVKRSKLNYSLPQTASIFAAKKIGLRMDKHCKRRTLKTQGGGTSLDVETSQESATGQSRRQHFLALR